MPLTFRVACTLILRAWLLLLLLLLSCWTVKGDDELCPCKFDGKDADTCRVYGQLGDGELIAWYKASQDCLDAHKIKISAIPPFQLESMCNPPNANAFVNYLKFESSAAATSIKQGYGDFWDGDANPVTLVDSINGVDCKASANDCWNEIKAYFTANPDEVEDNCQTFYNAAAKDLEAEQSVVRIAICNNEVNAATACGNLQTQVQDLQAANTDKACSAFGLGPGSKQLPVCDGDPASSPSPTSTSGGYGAKPLMLIWIWSLLFIAAATMCSNLLQ